MEYSPTFCLAGFKGKIDNYSKKNQKIGQGKILCRDIVSECHDRILIEPAEVMSQQGLS